MAAHGTDLSAESNLQLLWISIQKLEYIVNKSLCMLTDFTDFADFMETEIVIRH